MGIGEDKQMSCETTNWTKSQRTLKQSPLQWTYDINCTSPSNANVNINKNPLETQKTHLEKFLNAVSCVYILVIHEI